MENINCKSQVPSKVLPKNTNFWRSRVANSDFDYYHTKKEFYKEVENYYRKKKFRTKITREQISDAISEIKKGDLLVGSGLPQSHKYNGLSYMYKVIQVDTEDLLVLRSNTLRIVAFEDIFDVLLEAHVSCGYAGKHHTGKEVRKLYNVSQVMLDIFINICNEVTVNKTKRNTLTLKPKSIQNPKTQVTDSRVTLLRFNHSVQVGYIDMNGQPDGPYNHILYYADKVTEFLILRPLESFEDETDLSEELLNIFADFGPPLRIETYYSRLIISCLNLLCRNSEAWKINVTQTPQEPNTLVNFIKEELKIWMEENDCYNWSIGCRMLQFQRNTSKKTGRLCSPYDEVFGYNSNYDIFKDETTNVKDCKISQDSADINK